MLSSVREFAPAKINLALHVLGRRKDGYHELDSVVAFASVGDELEIEVSDSTSLRVDGPFANDVPLTPDNLVLKAHAALTAVADIPQVAMHLTKNLPVASGIGGGSADAAAALRGLMRLSNVRFEPETMQNIALSLGADVPVCLRGTACRMQGVGDVISDVKLLPARVILLVNPLVACSTADVFRKMGLNAGDALGLALDELSPATWRNDMLTAAIAVQPAIANVLSALNDLVPQSTVRMSGSGATCFALCDRLADAEDAAKKLRALYPNWWIALATLS
jgi:4-diphosphocytidyl-2-C-methyl-D-erythritol kinase